MRQNSVTIDLRKLRLLLLTDYFLVMERLLDLGGKYSEGSHSLFAFHHSATEKSSWWRIWKHRNDALKICPRKIKKAPRPENAPGQDPRMAAHAPRKNAMLPKKLNR